MTLVDKRNTSLSAVAPVAAINRAYLMVCAFLMTLSASTGAFAAGTDTGSSAMTSLQTWMMEWIPLGAALLIIACAVAWIGHMIQAAFAVRVVVGLILIGSASYIVGLLGVS